MSGEDSKEAGEAQNRQNSWQQNKHVRLFSDLLLSLKEITFDSSGFSVERELNFCVH